MICVLRRLMLFCVVFRSAYSHRPIRDVGDLIVLLCVVCDRLSSSCSEVQSVPRVLLSIVLRSVYSFGPSFRVKPLCKLPQKNFRNSSVLRRFCHPKLSKDRAIFFFYCDPLHFVAILLHSAFRVHHGVCSGGQAGGSAPMLTMHRGARIPRRPPSFAVSAKKCPAEVENGILPLQKPINLHSNQLT